MAFTFLVSTAVSVTDDRLVKLQNSLAFHKRSKSVSLFKLCFHWVHVLSGN